jgi:predicted permease
MNNPLLTGHAHLSNAKFPGYVPHTEEDPTNTWILSYDVGPHYFNTLRMQLMAGRDFTEADNEHAPPVVIVNEALAKHYFSGKNPIGQKVVLGSIFKRADQNDKTEAEIVAVVRNAHYFDVQDQQQEAIFTALFQVLPDQFGWAQTVIIRTGGNPTTLANDVRAVVQKIDANLSLFNVTTMSNQLDNSLSQPRLLALLSSFFGGLALTLSAIGLYGVLAYSVNKRIGEIGIRMALGANRGRILKLILGETAQVLVIGIVAGLALAGAASRLIKSMLYGLSAHDAGIFALSALVLVAVALLATLRPARRALDVEPMAALRYE